MRDTQMHPDEFTFTLFHLDDDSRVRDHVKSLEDELNLAFQEWFEETFRIGRVKPDPVQLVILSAQNLGEFGKMLLGDPEAVGKYLPRLQQANARPRLVLTKEGQRAVCFWLDHYIGGYDEGELLEQDWPLGGDMVRADIVLETLFPATPKVFLTRTDPVDLDRPEGYAYWKKDLLDNPENLIRNFQHLLDTWYAPSFLCALMRYARRGSDSWHTPGHNRGNAFIRSNTLKPLYKSYHPRLFNTDLSVSVESLGDLSEPGHESPLVSAQQRSADTFGACDTYYITNGTSTSNRVMLIALLRPGDVVLLDRNCHKSVHQAVTLSGALPLYLQPAYNETLGVWAPVNWEELSTQLERDYPAGLQPRMLILTTCTYEGILYPIHQIAEICSRRGILFYADEAWAPYLRFHPYYVDIGPGELPRPLHALGGGAHFAVQSTHKALSALSQASMIHISPLFKDLLDAYPGGNGASASPWSWLRKRFGLDGRGSYARFKHELDEVLRYAHSTSPFYPIMATLDGATSQIRLEGKRLLSERLSWVTQFYQKVEELAPGCVVRLDDIVESVDVYPGYRKDPLKIILQCKTKQAMAAFKDRLKEGMIQWEKSTDRTIQFLVTLGTYEEHLYALLDVVYQHKNLLGPARARQIRFNRKLTSQGCEISPQRAALMSTTELVKLEYSEGRIVAQMVVPYPPGIPVMLPGLRITKDMISLVRQTKEEKGAEAIHGLYMDGDDAHISVITTEERRVGDEKAKRLIKHLEDEATLDAFAGHFKAKAEAKQLQELQELMYTRPQTTTNA